MTQYAIFKRDPKINVVRPFNDYEEMAVDITEQITLSGNYPNGFIAFEVGSQEGNNAQSQFEPLYLLELNAINHALWHEGYKSLC